MKAKSIVNKLLETDEEVPMVRLGEIMKVLPPDVQSRCIEILNTEHDDGSAYSLLKKLVAPYAKELEVVGVIAGYFPIMLLQARFQLQQSATDYSNN